MLTKSGAKLLDFGLAKLLPQHGLVEGVTSGPAANLTVEGSIIGTMQYMPPEQLEGREVDARSDIFAFGAMLGETGIRRVQPGESHRFDTYGRASPGFGITATLSARAGEDDHAVPGEEP